MVAKCSLINLKGFLKKFDELYYWDFEGIDVQCDKPFINSEKLIFWLENNYFKQGYVYIISEDNNDWTEEAKKYHYSNITENEREIEKYVIKNRLLDFLAMSSNASIKENITLLAVPKNI